MKKRYLFVFIIVFFLAMPIYALENSKDYSYSNVIDIVSYKDGYYVLKATGEVIKYDKSDNVVSQKKFNDIDVNSITNYNNNYIICGTTDNLLSIYIIDENLRVVHNSTLDIAMNGSDVNAYYYEDKLYLVISLDGIISSTKIVEIDKSFNISMKQMSDISNFKDIIKGDYYLYNNDDINHTYLASVNIDEDYYIVGYTNVDGKIKGIIKKNTDNVIETDDEYKNIDSLVLDGKIYVLSTNDTDSKITIYDDILDKIDTISLSGKAFKLDIYFNNLVVLFNDRLSLYQIDLSINSEDNLFGNIDLLGDRIPYENITVNVTANSGYEVSEIVVRTSSGEKIDVIDNGFVMPEDSVIVSVYYKEVVENPETVDKIVLIVFCCLILVVILRKLYVKYRWLK